jgi:hypothetical protein
MPPCPASVGVCELQPTTWQRLHLLAVYAAAAAAAVLTAACPYNLLFAAAENFKQHFERFGKVVEAQIMVDHTSGRSRGFG